MELASGEIAIQTSIKIAGKNPKRNRPAAPKALQRGPEVPKWLPKVLPRHQNGSVDLSEIPGVSEVEIIGFESHGHARPLRAP